MTTRAWTAAGGGDVGPGDGEDRAGPVARAGPAGETVEQPGTGRTGVLRLGTLAWAWLGIIGLAVVVVLGLATVAGLVVPLIVAVVVATLLVPVVDALERRRVPRPAGALLVLLGLVLVVAGVVWLAVVAVVSQWPLVTADVRAGLVVFTAWLAGLGVDIGTPRELLGVVLGALGAAAAGPTTVVGGVLASVTATAVGSLVALLLVFLMLTDWHRVIGWLTPRLPVPDHLGPQVVDDVVVPLRRYYAALTWSNALVSVAIAITAAVMDVPLALAIGVVTFVTSYVPYLGAIVSGTFAVLVAFGSGGAVPAAVLLVMVLLMQNVVQTLILVRVTGTVLSLHPLVTFSATIVGASVGGFLGASLGVPVVAVARRVTTTLRAG